MRLNTDEIEVRFNEELHKLLVKIFKYSGKRKPKVETILETGTYNGEGSTLELAKVIVEAGREDDTAFYTLEANRPCYETAKKNLEQFSFIQPLHALSLNLQECLDFISNDEMILNHEKYPDLIIDSDQPEWFYRTEVYSPFSGDHVPPTEGLFYELIPIIKENNPLILLDSSGGIGWLEFSKVMELMEDNHYYLLTDDCGKHIKHSRTREYVEKNENWKILFFDGRVMLAEYLGG